MSALDEIRGRLAAATPNPDVEWAALTDPGDAATEPAWIVDADDIEVRLPATYKAGKLAEFIANAPADVAALLRAVGAVESLVKHLDGLADGDKHYAKLFRSAVTSALEGKA